MKNKKAFLLAETTLKIVIALIAIGILIYFLVSLYYANVADKELEQAKATLNRLVEEINVGATEFEIYNLVTKLVGTGRVNIHWNDVWFLAFFETQFPKSCPDSPCICICQDPSIFPNEPIKACDKKGVCLHYNQKVILENDKLEFLSEDSIINLNILKQDGEIKITKK